MPVFLTIGPSQLTRASFNGFMELEVEASGVPSCQLQITDTSLFVFYNTVLPRLRANTVTCVLSKSV